MQNKKENKENNYRVPKGTTHLMMWLGGSLPTERKVKYQNKNGEPLTYEDTKRRNEDEEYKLSCTVVNYVKTLQKECEKMREKGESCILVYDSRMIKPKDKQEMENIVKEIPNCYLVDYEDYVKELKNETDLLFQGSYKGYNEIGNENRICKQSEFIKDIDDNITFNSETNGLLELQMFSIGNLVDCMRILLLLHPGKLKKLANEKNKNKKNLNEKDYTLLYHDFDMIQKETKPLDQKAQKNNDEQIREKEALFCKNMDNGCACGNENGLIWVNSNGDRNKVLEDMICIYVEYNTANYTRNIFHQAYKAEGNNFAKQFFDESHQSWKIGSEADIKKNINICENDYSTITERKLIGLLDTCYKEQFATIPIQLNNGNEVEISITEFLSKVNKAQNNKYQDYNNVAEKIFTGANNKNNEKTYYENIKLEKDERDKIDYNVLTYSDKVKQLEKQIAEQINNHLGKSKDKPKILHWDKDPKKGCKNGKLLNTRLSFKEHSDYINSINNFYDKQLIGHWYNGEQYVKKYDQLQDDGKCTLLMELKKYVDKLETKQINANKKKSFYPCASKNDYKEVKSDQHDTAGLNVGRCSQQGIY